VSERIDGTNYFALTGEAGQAAAAKLATKDGVVGEHHTRGSALCFDAEGKILWREDFSDSEALKLF